MEYITVECAGLQSQVSNRQIFHSCFVAVKPLSAELADLCFLLLLIWPIEVSGFLNQLMVVHNQKLEIEPVGVADVNGAANLFVRHGLFVQPLPDFCVALPGNLKGDVHDVADALCGELR